MFRFAAASRSIYKCTTKLAVHQQSLAVRPIRRAASSKVVVSTNKALDDSGDAGNTVSSPFLSKISVNDKHQLFADEPTGDGGIDAGPSPYDLLLSALGSCTVMTLRMYADRKKLPLEGVSVTLTHDKIHKKDCEECNHKDDDADDDGKKNKKKKSPLFDRIERIISIKGDDLTEKERSRLLEIANICPVHRTLEHGQVVIVSSLAPSEK